MKSLLGKCQQLIVRCFYCEGISPQYPLLILHGVDVPVASACEYSYHEVAAMKISVANRKIFIAVKYLLEVRHSILLMRFCPCEGEGSVRLRVLGRGDRIQFVLQSASLGNNR